MPAPTPPAPYLDAQAIARLLPPGRALAAVQRFFGALRREEVAAPDRIHMAVPEQETVGLYMAAATAQYVGVKLAHLMAHRRPNVEAEIFLYDAATGRLLFWGDGKPLTALRTAAVSAAASLRLKPEVRRLVVIGSGVQAAAHLRAFAAAYPALKRPLIVARSVDAYDRLVASLGAGWRGRLALCEKLPRALGEADAIVTTTPAPEPLFAWRDVAPGCHVAAIGSAAPSMHELPTEAFLASEVWLDSRRALAESGDCRAALAAGWREADVAGDLFDLLSPAFPQSRVSRKDSPRRGTLFKSTGHATQDLALLIALWEAWLAEHPPHTEHPKSLPH